ncbi:hypothetical protein IV203_016996 [Nitzschia inconspicua]|uniref:Uncharacterized protein n=1 Tax=Nitzschia inconspicua TaxID=303405 RepID=A0A9K3KRI1_9STRA|nr:hypothetical protein IV203_016996 [Nitzschia inconspicua]
MFSKLTMKALILICCHLCWVPLATAAKRLVAFAGPHETGGGAVNKFFATHASATADESSALGGWTWPTIDDNEEGDIVASPHHLFDLLVEEQDNANIQSKLLAAIRTAFENSDNGIIIGSLLLDRVGTNPDTGYDAVSSLNTVVTELELSPEDVVVAITYRTPRIDQWASIFHNHFDFDLYEDFVCSEGDQVKNQRWEWLDTCMNPFFVAKSYHDSGFDVVMIDEAGTINSGKDVAHVLACHFTDGKNCEDDWLAGLEDETVDLPSVVPINELGETRSGNLEELFRLRDCYYMTQFDSQERFEILNSEITDCRASLMSYYKQFADTDFLMNAIQSQKMCETSQVDVPSLLAQKDDVTNDNDYKKLVIFVGPHETQAGEILQFFVNYASTSEGSTLSPSFNGWMWPDIQTDLDADIENYNIFDLLVSEAMNDEVQSTILDEINRNWQATEKGLILGSVLFQSIDSTPYSGYDGLAAVQRIVDKIGIDNAHVAIVLSYRTPRVDHWGAAWDGHFSAPTYNEFVCSDEEEDKRWEWLNSSMNPFGIAKAYFDEGYRVVVMDERGIVDAGLDISHAIACEILEGISCEDGFVLGLSEVTTDPFPSYEIDALSEQDQADLEALFFGRDCYYADILPGSHRFHILNDHGIWDECTLDMTDAYQDLADTDVLLNAIQAQQECQAFDVDLPSLIGRYDSNGIGTDDDLSGTDDDWSGTDDSYVGKKFVIFAGPHETAGVNITKFLSRFAAPNSPEFSDSFDGWIWPYVDTESFGHTLPAHREFEVLVKAEVDPEIQDYFIQALKESWDNAERGVVIGGLEFDKTGINPYTGYNPLGVVRRLADSLAIPDEDVIIVVDYRAPRMDQWSAIWKNVFGDLSYEEFVCSDEEALALKRWEYIDTVMNPMKVASAYAEQGWNVAVIDYYGTSHVGRDVAHVLSCEVMNGVDCEEGWVRDLKGEQIPPPSYYQIDELPYTDRNELEQAFLFRDCSYKTKLEQNVRVDVYHQKKLWEVCSAENEFLYRQLQSTDQFVALLQSQLSCGPSTISLSNFLSGVEQYNPNGGRSHLAGVTMVVALLAVLFTIIAFYLAMRRSRVAKRAAHELSDGVFRDSPSVDGRVGPFRDESVTQVSECPDSVELTVEELDEPQGQTYLKKVQKSLKGGAIAGQSVRSGPYRDDSEGKSRERSYSGEDRVPSNASTVVMKKSAGHQSFPNEDILLKLDSNESLENFGYEV